MRKPNSPDRTPAWLLAIAMALVLVVVLSSFALSFTVLRDLAALSGIPSTVAWLWPVIVDGTITAATVMLYTNRHDQRRRVMPMATLILFGLASVVGNVAHILIIDPSTLVPVPLAAFVGIVPPVGLILTVELLGSLLRSKEAVTTLTAENVANAVVVLPDIAAVTPAVQPTETPAEISLPVPSVQPAAHVADLVETPVPAQDDPGEIVPETPTLASPEPVNAIMTTEPEMVTGVVSLKTEPPRKPAQKPTESPVDQRASIVDQARQLIDGGLSQRAAAEQLDVSRATLSRWIKASDEAEENDEPMGQLTTLHAVNS